MTIEEIRANAPSRATYYSLAHGFLYLVYENEWLYHNDELGFISIPENFLTDELIQTIKPL